MIKKIISLVCAIICVTMAKAQWTDDAKSNTLISESGKLFCSNVKAVKAPNGNIFVSWLSYEYEGGDENSQGMTKLQLLDQDGNALWETGGIYVSQHTTATWGTDFSLGVTPDNCAIVAFSDSRTDPEGKSHFKPYVYKIDQEGNFLWGLNGIALPCTSIRCYRPRVCVTNAGSVIVGYSDEEEGGFVMQRINEEGSLVWSENLRASGSMGNLVACDEDDYIVIMMGGEGSITAQRYDAYGELIWNKAVTNESIYAHAEPQVKSDGQNGAVVSYMIQTTNNQEFYVCLQRINADGEAMMGIKPIRTSKELATHRGVSFGVDPKDESIISLWEKVRQNVSTLCVTKLDYFGDEMWGKNGMELQSQQMWGYSGDGVIPTEDEGCIVVYRKHSGAVDHKVMAQRLDKYGESVWEKDMSGISYKSKCILIPYTDQICAIWQDTKMSDQALGGEIYGQNISYDGKLGKVTRSIESINTSDKNNIYYDGRTQTLNLLVTAFENPVEVRLYNISGMLLNQYNNLPTDQNQISLETKALLPGTYIVKIACDKGKSFYSKIMVK